MWKRYRETREYHLYEAYKRQCNKAQNEVKKAKWYFEKKLAENIKTEPKSFYAYTRSKTRTKDSVRPLVDLMGEVITDSIQAENLFNDYFAIYTDEEMSNLPDPVNIFTKTIEVSLQTIEFTIAIVQEKLSKIKPNKAPGIDNFSSSMLREVSSAIASPLCEIFNGSIEMEEVPLDWKKANVTSIYKNKGTKSQPCNYRPVSLTSHISKTMESIITYKRLE